jgi:HSP20 family protein
MARERGRKAPERNYRLGGFQYRTTLPPGIHAEGIEARFDSGVLTVRVPRSEEAKRRRIKIT